MWKPREGDPESEVLGLGTEADVYPPPAGLSPGLRPCWNEPAKRVTWGQEKGGGRIRHTLLVASGKGFAVRKPLLHPLSVSEQIPKAKGSELPWVDVGQHAGHEPV